MAIEDINLADIDFVKLGPAEFVAPQEADADYRKCNLVLLDLMNGKENPRHLKEVHENEDEDH